MMMLVREIRRLALVCLTIVLVVTITKAQQRILWQGAVMPERINVYASTSTRDRVTTTLKQGEAVDVILEINTLGDAWCRIAFSGQSEPLGYVFCHHLEQGHFPPKQSARSEPVAAQSHAQTASILATQKTTEATVVKPAVLTNKDILDMNKIGLPPEVLVAKVKSSQCNFDTSPASLQALKTAGVGDNVILAMVQAPGVQGLAPSDPPPASASAGTEIPAREAASPQPVAPMAHRKMVLEDNTPVHLVLNENLSSASATTGQTISFEVSEDVLVGGFVVIPRSSLAWGTVTEAQAKRRLGRAGHLDVNIDKVRLADGEKVLLSATSHAKGGSHTAAMTAGIVATSLIVWPAAPFFLFMHGHDVTIPKGTKIEAFTNGDATLDAANFVPAPK
jgi:hypothetical protein